MAITRRQIFNSCFTLFVQLIRYVPYVDSLVTGLTGTLPQAIPAWLGKASLYGALSLSAYFFVRSRYGDTLYGLLVRFTRFCLRVRPSVYSAVERNSAEFRRDIIRSLNNSTKMYCLLVSGFTMFDEDESFIKNELLKLKRDDMDIRFLLLSREMPCWKERAQHFYEARLVKKGITISDYEIILPSYGKTYDRGVKGICSFL